MDLPAAAVALFALPPSRFVEERNALAKELAARRDPAAGAVRKIGRPTGLAWVMNRLAHGRPRDVEALLRAGDRLRAGHRRALAGEGAEELRAAEEEVRERARGLRTEAQAALGEAGRRADPGVLSRLELLLRVVASGAGPEREAFRRGVLEREPAVATEDVGGLAVLAGGHPSPAVAPKGDGAARARDERRASTREASKAREAERARKDSRRELVRAEAALRRADDAAHRAEEAARRATERARELRARADAARQEAARRREALRSLGDA